MNRDNNPQSFINGLLLGAVLGMAFAPASGSRTRQKIMDFAEEKFGDLKEDLEGRRDQLQTELERIEREISTRMGRDGGDQEDDGNQTPRRGRRPNANRATNTNN